MATFLSPKLERELAGVYRVKFDTGHFYIGSSVHLKHRFEQWKTRLINGIRKNIDMLTVYQIATTVEFEIIEVVEDAEVLKHREDFYISLFWGMDKLLNKSPSAFTNLGSKQSLDRIKPKTMQPMAKIDIEGNIIEQYESVAECASKNNVNEKEIRRSVKRLGRTCNGITYRKIAKDGSLITPPFVPPKPRPHGIRYKVSEESKEKRRQAALKRKAAGVVPKGSKTINQYKNGEFVKSHLTISDAAKDIGLKDERRLRKLLNGRAGKTIYGFTFCFAD